MRVAFYFPRPEPYNSSSVRELPSGGTEKSVIFLGEALQKLGYTVDWLTTPEQIHSYKEIPDVAITQVAALFEQMSPKTKKVWWTHHFSDQPVIKQNVGYARAYADHVITLSLAHYNDFKDNLRLDTTIIGHGIWWDELDYSTAREPYHCIYASAPFRGLSEFKTLWPVIKNNYPEATISICSSMKTYGQAETDAQYTKLFDDLSKTPGIELKSALNQTQLYSEYRRAFYFLYPNIWAETYCIALDEAKAHGCIPIVTNNGALGERVNKTYTVHQMAREPWMDKHVADSFKRPKDWMEIALEWQRAVLSA